MPFKLDSELAHALAATPEPSAPPEGVQPHVAMREWLDTTIAPHRAYYAARLPPGTFPSIEAFQRVDTQWNYLLQQKRIQ